MDPNLIEAIIVPAIVGGCMGVIVGCLAEIARR